MSQHTINIAAPCMGVEEWEALREPLETGWLTQGPKVAEFERAFARHHDVGYAVAVTSATTGLHLALAALGLGETDEVILPAFTWVSTANVVLFQGATPVFVDVDPVTYNIDPQRVKEALTERTRVVMPVHLFGRCVEMDEIRGIVPDGVHVVEDAACAVGGTYKGQPAGSLGACGVFSFHPRKSITTGEGGMLTTNDDVLAEQLRTLRNHGAAVSEEARHAGPKPYLLPTFRDLGFNYRMTDLQGAVGLTQLRKLDRFIDERQRWAAYYRETLSDLTWLRLPTEEADSRHAWQAFVTYVDPATAPMSRNDIMEHLQAHQISTRPGTHAVHMLEYYRDHFGFRPEDFPCAASCDQNTMAIPLHNRMDPDDFRRVADTLHELSR